MQKDLLPTYGTFPCCPLQSYARSYAHFGIHHEMLSDRARTLAYRRAIEMNAAAVIRGRRVLDVGCGTAILSLFCARAGADSVTAVDMSSIIQQARKTSRCGRKTCSCLTNKSSFPLL